MYAIQNTQEISERKRKPGGLYPTLVALLNSKGEWSLCAPKTFKTREAAERYLARHSKGQVTLGVTDNGETKNTIEIVEVK